MNRIFTTLFFLAAANFVMGENISEQQAIDIATNFFNTNASSTRSENAQLTVAQSSMGYYAINRGSSNGYVIVAATDQLGAEVLGYADTGSIDPENMPDNLRWWLSEYDRQANYAANHNINVSSRSTTDHASRAAIEPLLTTNWDQDEPYNNNCPTYEGERCYTGCVATAIAQIMNYHKWPRQGSGSVTYMCYQTETDSMTLSRDFSGSTYDWENMSDTYNSSNSEASNAAVAKLMEDVGYGCEMWYTPYGSAANSIDAAQALVKYFSYDKAIKFIYRDYYTHDEWEDLLYGELAASRPLYYAGNAYNEENGHAFVMDGYKDCYYHINWGWGGVSNGYFLITDLFPSIQGVGGLGTDYSYDAEAIVGIRPLVDGSEEEVNLYSDIDFKVNGSTTLTNASTASFTCDVLSNCISTHNIVMGLKVVDGNGTVSYVKSTSDPKELEPSNDIETTFEVSMSDFPKTSGSYDVYAACYVADLDKWVDIRSNVYMECQSHVVATVSGSTITFGNPTSTSKASLAISNVELTYTPYAETTLMGTAICKATNGDYYGNIMVGFRLKDETEYKVYDDMVTLVDLGDGESQKYSFSTTAPDSAATYYMSFMDSEGNAFGEPIEVAVKSIPAGDVTLEAVGISMPSTTDVAPSDINITFNVKCTSGLYDGVFYAFVYGDEDEDYLAYLVSDEVVIGNGEETAVVFSAPCPVLEPNSHYHAVITSSSSTPIAPSKLSEIDFTTSVASSIESMSTDNEPQSISIYSIDGTLVDKQFGVKPDFTGMPKGIYIVTNSYSPSRHKICNR